MVTRVDDRVMARPAAGGPLGAGPRVAVVFLQPRCNMHCTFCITQDNFNAFTFDQAASLRVERLLQFAKTDPAGDRNCLRRRPHRAGHEPGAARP